MAAIDPAGEYPERLAGPGLTVDEIFNVEQGVLLVDHLLDVDFLGYLKTLEGLHDHPPLGRLLLGTFHEAAYLFSPPPSRPPFSIACARTGSAAAFAATVFLVGCCCGRWYGPVAGIVGSLSLVLMPRLFGHAHLAALESGIGLTYAAAVLAVAATWGGESPPTRRQAAWTGVLFGLALLTKIQAILLPIPIAAWTLWRWRRQALLPVAIWGGVGLAVLFVGWPWLWGAPIARLFEYLGSTADRATVYVWYFGRQFADRDVPWHYPWVLFLTTVPVGLHLLGFGGIAATWRNPIPWKQSPREILIASCLLFPLLVFSLPGVAVYDGARLFLVVFPLWGIFIGRGGEACFALLRRKLSPRLAGIALAVLLLLQGYGIVALAPTYLSYYNLLVGGLRGAERLGLATTYWGDSLTRELLDRTAELVPAGSTVAVAPVLHPFQLPAMMNEAPQLRARRIVLQPYDEKTEPAPRYVLTFPRREYLPESWVNGPPGAEVLAEVVREGVRLAGLYELSPEEH